MLCTLCGLPAKLTHNYCQACGHELPAATEHRDREPAVETEIEMAVAASEAPQEASPFPDLPTRWLSFWTYFVLPVHAFFSLLLGLPLFVLAKGFIQALGFHYVALGAVCVGVSIGLELRRRWAWELNRLLVFLLMAEVVVLGASLEVAAIRAADGPIDFSAVATGALVIVTLSSAGALLWLWPNHAYWRKREALFQSSGGLVVPAVRDRTGFGGILGLWFLGRRLPATCAGVVLLSLGLTFAAVGLRSLERPDQVERSTASANAGNEQPESVSVKFALGASGPLPR